MWALILVIAFVSALAAAVSNLMMRRSVRVLSDTRQEVLREAFDAGYAAGARDSLRALPAWARHLILMRESD